MKDLILIRGLPGSGKSTRAREVYVPKGFDHFEADMFFLSDEGEYNFDPSKLKLAHAWCRDQVLYSLASDRDVVVSNTFVKMWEIEPYEHIASEMNAVLTVEECHDDFGSVHDIPAETIERMRQNWEDLRLCEWKSQ